VSTDVERFTERDLLLVKAIAGWIGIVTGRAELANAMTRRAFERGRRNAADELTRLTSRQREIATLIAEGLTNADRDLGPRTRPISEWRRGGRYSESVRGRALKPGLTRIVRAGQVKKYEILHIAGRFTVFYAGDAKALPVPVADSA